MFPAGVQQTTPEKPVDHVTCLGCGCACDDIAVRVDAGRIVEASNACPLGAQWFGDGTVPSAIRTNGRDAALDDALTAVADMLKSARLPLIYLAPDVSCEAQRETVALADRMRGVLDTISSATALPSILAMQERGRTSATLGEIRNRADTLVFWGVDPSARYPRYWSRYAPEPVGLQVENGRRGRRVIAVDIGQERGPADTDVRVAVEANEEVALLTAIAALVAKPGTSVGESLAARAQQLASQLSSARYIALVADGEPPLSSSSLSAGASAKAEDSRLQFRDPQRAAALNALAHALNGATRCALNMLRGGGNRSGAEAVLTAHTGFPTGVTFADGAPGYRPYDAGRRADVVLVVGDASQIPADLLTRFAAGPLAIIGPRASAHTAAVTIDTGIAGIHVNGTALRMDDVPLRLRPVLHRGLDPAEVVGALARRISRHAMDPASPSPRDPSVAEGVQR